MGAVVLGLLVSAKPAHAGTVSVEGVRMKVPAGWRSSRGAATDGRMGQLFSPSSVADGEESFVIWSEPLQAGDLETTARHLQKQMAERRPQASPVDKVRLFYLGDRPGIRAELIGTDPWGGEPARVVYWVVAKSPTSALVFRAILLNTRYSAFASKLEGFVRSWTFPASYTGPKVVLSSEQPTQEYGNDYADDAWHEGMAGEESGGWQSEQIGGGVEVEMSEATIPDDPYARALPIDAGSLTGNFCAAAGASTDEGLQFDGKGQWALHQGLPPQDFSVVGVPPDDSGFYKVEGATLRLRAHTGAERRCISPRNGILRCQGIEYDRALCR